MGIGDDIANALNPNRNGVGDWFKNDFAGFLKNDFAGSFLKGNVLPIVKNLGDITVQSFTAPMVFMNKLFQGAGNVVSGDGIYFLLIGVGVIVIIGGVVYYQNKK